MLCYISAKHESERLVYGSVHARQEELWQTIIIICVYLTFVFNPIFSWVCAGEVKKQDGELLLFFVLPRTNENIRLDGVLRIGGKDKPESRVLGYCCRFGYLIKGGSALIEQGQTVRTVLSRDCVI